MEQKMGPKDAFLHLLSIIALYVSAGSLISLIFDYVNVLRPDKLADNYYTLLSAYSSIRWSTAILVVVFPVYVWSVWYLNRDFEKIPEKRNLKIRKWLVYFTLFLAAGIIIGDLVALIYNFLQGELTTRFLLKILAVFAAAGVVFGYYLREVKSTRRKGSSLFAYPVIVIVVATIIAGFFIAGSPKEERARRFDDQRVQDLQSIQSEIVNWFVQKGALPEKLADLNDSIRGVIIPKDPETGAAYIYEIKNKENFTLCAIFNLPSVGAYYGNENWAHGRGQTCFDRKIDKDLYKPVQKR